ncbi:Uncharacterised protein [Halioglobus japonicus]|nr:Uncharacterised protein [Halioglobus japonicus]
MIKKAITLSSMLLLVTACGGSSNNNNNNDDTLSETGNLPVAAGKTGKLIDSAIQGVSYSTPSFSGKTNNRGEYSYKENETVDFSIGDITFPGITAKGILTPLDLAGTSDLTDTKLINITRLLQSLDNDQNPANGIVIDDGITTAALNFNLSEADFADEVQAKMAVTLIDTTVAIAHLKSELDKLNIGTSNEQAANVPAGLLGSYNFRYQLVNAGYSAADAEEQAFEVLSGDILKLPDGSQLTNPVFVDGNKVEIIWKDSANNFVYALSNATTGSINELNVSNTTFGQNNYIFYGSFTPVTTTVGEIPSGLLSLAGIYTSTAQERSMSSAVRPDTKFEVTLSIDATTGVITVGDYYTIDPGSEHFGFNDDTNKNPMFSPRYEIFDQTPEGNNIKLILHRQVGEPLNSWQTQDKAADLIVSATVTPIPQNHTDFMNDLAAVTPATLAVTSQNTDYNSGLDAPVCTEYELSVDNSIADEPRVLLEGVNNSFPSTQLTYGHSSAFYEDEGGTTSLNFAANKIEIKGGVINLVPYKLGAPSGDELSNDPEKIRTVCP